MSDDLIKRSDVIKVVRKSKWWHFCDLIPVLSAIKDIPSADGSKGHWVDGDGNIVSLDKNGCPTGSAFCSRCGEWLTASDEYNVTGNFCPNCGADMRETTND